MAEKHLVLCGNTKLTSRSKEWREAPTLRLALGSGKKQLHLKIHHITRKLASQLPDAAVDLLELAAYVYTADQMVSRGGPKEFEYGNRFRRHFRFEVPVRCPDMWSSSTLRQQLVATLGFLSDDDYEFEFVKLDKNQPVEGYLFDEEDTDAGFEEVILFSGGLDSFAGAVQEILQGQRKVVLVSHRSVSKLFARQRDLVADITQRLTDRSKRPLHVAVEINKSEEISDYTQRSRSFLFAALAAVVARAFSKDRIRFYENGIVSFNFPISPQALGGRASRTTHPQVLKGFEAIFSLVFGRPFGVENPFLWKTKADVCRELKAAGVAQLSARTSSCTHTRAQSTMHSHCGLCSQCVDRRLNALAAEFTNDDDPREMYAEDVVTGAREGADLTMIERYLGTSLEVDGMQSVGEFISRFPELARVLRHVDMSTDVAARAVFKLHKDHAQDICRTVASLVRDGADAVVRRIYPPNCLLSIAVGRQATLQAVTLPVPNADRTLVESGRKPFADSETFTANFLHHKIVLGNTLEFAIFERLSRRVGIYISNTQLASDVWNDDMVAKLTIQRTVCNLRRRLKGTGLVLDGSNKNHYALKIADAV
jgi:7-cyano-7-deazaguanine synthase in queuosine biosynthesis